MPNALDGLNQKQKEASLYHKGPLMIIAGAGAGKTKVITERIAEIIKSGVAPESILAITFTNKSAKEMRDRVERRLSAAESARPISFKERPFISTFHALCVHILRENSRLLGISRNFSIFDRDDSRSAVRRSIVDAGLDPKRFEPGTMLSAIGREKNAGLTVERYKENAEGYFADNLIRVWERYEKELADSKALDFDDLLLRGKELLQKYLEVRKHYANIWHYIHVDEYQDTNKVQYEILRLLSESHKNVCVVGDMDQSIYSWRGADVQNLFRFEEDYAGTKVVILEENYRSTKIILEAANSVIRKNVLRKEKNLFTNKERGEKIILHSSWTEEDEARFITDTVENIRSQGEKLENMAVLYRANFQSRILEEAFLREGIPHQVLGVRFFERKEVKDMLSYLAASLEPEGLGNLKRVINNPPRGLGKVAIAKIFSGQKSQLSPSARASADNFFSLLSKIGVMARSKPVSETLMYILEKSGLKDSFEKGGDGPERLENAMELVSLAGKYKNLSPEDGAIKLLEDAALATDQDELKEEKAGVKLMTVHAAKGLEFEHVFVAGLEEDLFPHKKPESDKRVDGDQALEEERRLFYVALTRAKKRLYLSHASSRSIYGSRQVNIPSQFLMDIDEELIEEGGEEKERVIYLDE
ncbi:MAG: UvrD-helicase domain-containing protein [Patescibacteria group bacterium]